MARSTHNRKDLTGQTFGRLTAIEKAPSRSQYGTTVGYWLCRCECGNELDVPTGNLTSGNTKSCGCLNQTSRQGNSRAKTHGQTGTPTHISWLGMIRRIRDERPRYGGRGITVDPRWNSFENFLADMGERPAGHTLDRIDNDGPYSAANCRWAIPETQSNNRGNNRWITYDGRTQTIAQWARETGLLKQTLSYRLDHGWPVGEAFTTPSQRRRRQDQG